MTDDMIFPEGSRHVTLGVVGTAARKIPNESFAMTNDMTTIASKRIDATPKSRFLMKRTHSSRDDLRVSKNQPSLYLFR